jgi:hypothetical protein
MKKSRIFIFVATAALAVTAIFATKANKKFGNNYIGTLYYGLSHTHVSGKLNACYSQSPVLYTIAFLHSVANVFGITDVILGYKSMAYITLYK